MWHKITFKKVQKTVMLLLLGLFLTCTFVPPILNAAAKSDKGVITDSYKSFTGKNTSAENAVSKFGGSSDTTDPDTFGYVFGRLFIPGYLNNVTKYVPAKGSDESMITHSGSNYYLCNPDTPHNLVGYNCDLPNVSAQILQTFMGILSPSGITGNERQNAQPAFGLGIPKGIPGKKVPVDQDSRKASYTGLELFGYNLGTTTYNGEWDQINVSSSARLLSNYGALDKLKVAGSSIWNGAAKGVSAYVDNASLTNPISWFTAIGAAWNAGSSASINTILDTSDANVAMTHGWTRPVNLTANSYYNVYTLTDKQVVDVGQAQISKAVIALVNKELIKNPKVSKMLSLQSPPTGFSYDKDKKAKKGDKNAESEKAQLKDWLNSNKTVKEGESVGIDYGDPSNYNDFKSAWAQSAQSQLKSLVNDDSSNSVLKVVVKLAIKSAESQYPYGDPTQAIGHYVCADANGSPILDSQGNYKYVYEKNNKGTKEYLTPGCAPVRPTVEGGYFGDGYTNQKNTDTRSISHFHTSLWSVIPIIGSFSSFVSSLSTSIIRFIALITNTMLNLSFSPIMQQLGITKLVKVAFHDFSKSVFWPLLVIVISYAALMMFIETIRTQNARKFFTTFLLMFLVFVSAIVVFKNPGKTITYIEEVPLKVDNGLADIVLTSNNPQDLCRATGSGTKNGIRSAQCMVWKDTIFDTWTYAQFGAGYNNLFAKGATGLTSSQHTLNNTDTDLVGNARVNLGGGNVINNWAVYQLALMTSGTINQADTSHPVGQKDNNIYRIVDAQAGPDNAKGRDTTYWKYWTGQDGNRPFVFFLGAILAILAAIAIWGFLITKIELTFLTAVMFIGLPIMLLFGLTPRGQVKLKGYLFTLLGLYAKRLLMVFLLTTMLRVWDGVLSNSHGSYTQVFLASATILLFFIIYKPHMMKMLHFDNEDLFSGEGVFSGDHRAVREAIQRHTPLYIKNKLARTRANTRGAISGFIGGGLAGVTSGLEKAKINKNNRMLDSNDVSNANTFATIISSAKHGAVNGVRDNVNFTSRHEENILTRMGLSGFEEISATRHAVRDKAVDEMMSPDNEKSEMLKDIVNNTKYAKHYRQDEQFANELKQYLKQDDKQIAKMLKGFRAARKEIERMKAGEGTIASTAKTSAQLQAISDQVDKHLKAGEGKRAMFTHPLRYATNDHIDLKAREEENEKYKPMSLEEGYNNLHKNDTDVTSNEEVYKNADTQDTEQESENIKNIKKPTVNSYDEAVKEQGTENVLVNFGDMNKADNDESSDVDENKADKPTSAPTAQTLRDVMNNKNEDIIKSVPDDISNDNKPDETEKVNSKPNIPQVNKTPSLHDFNNDNDDKPNNDKSTETKSQKKPNIRARQTTRKPLRKEPLGPINYDPSATELFNLRGTYKPNDTNVDKNTDNKSTKQSPTTKNNHDFKLPDRDKLNNHENKNNTKPTNKNNNKGDDK